MSTLVPFEQFGPSKRGAKPDHDPWEDGRPLWERGKGETSKAFEAFAIYRDLGVGRSIREAAAELGKSPKFVAEWSSRWSWLRRVAAYDDEQDRIQRHEQEAAVRRMHDRHAQLAGAITGKVLDRLQTLDATDLKFMTLADLARTLEMAAKIERVARGQVSDLVGSKQQVEHSGTVGLELSAVVDEARRRRDELYGEIADGGG